MNNTGGSRPLDKFWHVFCFSWRAQEWRENTSARGPAGQSPWRGHVCHHRPTFTPSTCHHRPTFTPLKQILTTRTPHPPRPRKINRNTSTRTNPSQQPTLHPKEANICMTGNGLVKSGETKNRREKRTIHTNLIVAPGRFRPPQPDLVLPKTGGDVRNDSPDVDPLAGPIVPLQLRSNHGLKNKPQLLAQPL